MQNYVQKGDVLTLTAPYTRTSGQGALVGSIFGVACSDVTSGAAGQFQVEGVFTLPKDASDFAVGDLVYWNNAGKTCQKDDSGGTIIGVVVNAAAGVAATTVQVRLNGAFGI